MPFIATNNPELHKRIKKIAIDREITVGKLYEKFAEFGVALGIEIEKLSDKERDELISCIRSVIKK